MEFQTENIEIKKEQEHHSTGQRCPRCRRLNLWISKECTYCGILFDRYSEFGSLKLEKAWQKVLEDYDNKRSHLDFEKACEDHPLFLASKYSNMIKVNPYDENALQNLRKVEALTKYQAISYKNNYFTRPYFNIFIIGYLMVGVIIAFGLIIPHQIHLVFVGAIMAALIFWLKGLIN